MTDQQASEASEVGRIIELTTSSGANYHESMFEIQPFGASSFILMPRGDPGFWFLVPTRVVDLIKMGRAKDVNEQDSDETQVKPGKLLKTPSAASGLR